MSASIHLDRPQPHFTNLDFIKGTVQVHLPSETSIGGIQVKLEGESRTRLSGPRPGHPDYSDKRRTELEVHKILYKVATVFPTPSVLQHGSSGTAYTFATGTYEYPFEFKFPFNNACNPQNSMLTNLNITGLKVEMARDTNRHVKKTLPPSLSSFPGEAEVKYYLKVTIIRPQFYKENIRALAGLNFLPIEPPRTGNPSEETYARRQHQFSKGPTKSKTKTLFQKVSSPSPRDLMGEPPRLVADARLPSPSILTCNEPVPLRLLVKKMSETPDQMYLQMLQIELIAYTNILAQDLARTESGSWVIMSRSNMAMSVGRGTDPVGTEWTIDPGLWNQLPLPNSVAPTFETCNITRSYELEIRIGLSRGNPGAVRPQLIVFPLRMPVKVYSGIAPPKALLDAMAASGRVKPTQPQPGPSQDAERPPMPPRPAAPPVPAAAEENLDEAPPSYEDAMAETLGPVDGPRREYNPPDATPTRRTDESGADTKPSGNPGKDPEPRPTPTPYSNAENNSSSESFDMLPSTPPEGQSNSPPMSPVARQQSVLKSSKGLEDNPPQYQSLEPQLNVPQNSERRPSRPEFRSMNLGVPNRKPVPRSPSRGN